MRPRSNPVLPITWFPALVSHGNNINAVPLDSVDNVVMKIGNSRAAHSTGNSEARLWIFADPLDQSEEVVKKTTGQT
jgi:hypothetical protein